MSKRFTDSEKWKDDWFDGLSNCLKLFWIYLCDNCDHAGIWKYNKKLVEYHIGELDWEEIEKTFNGRIVKLENGKWFLPKFIKFQYPKGLSPKLDAHVSVIKILNDNNLSKYVSLMYQSQINDESKKDKRDLKETSKRSERPSQDMDMVMDKVMDKEGECEGEMPSANSISEANPSRPKLEDIKAYAFQIGFVGFDVIDFMNYYDSVGWKKNGSEIVDWSALVRAWKKREGTFARASPKKAEFDYAAAVAEAAKHRKK